MSCKYPKGTAEYNAFCERQRQNALKTKFGPKVPCEICGKNILKARYSLHIKSCANKTLCKRTYIPDSNKYARWYNAIIEKRKKIPIVDGHFERHHIIPRCCGGTDSKENLINLTIREHFICHALLPYIYNSDKRQQRALYSAIIIMKAGRGKHTYVNSRLYADAKRKYASLQREQTLKTNPMTGKVWLTSPNGERKAVTIAESKLLLEQGWFKKSVKTRQQRLEKAKLQRREKNGGKSREQLTLDKYQKQEKKDNTKVLTVEESKRQLTLRLRELYQIYLLLPWKDFVAKTGWAYSRANFVTVCKRHLPEYRPFNHQKKSFDAVYPNTNKPIL